GDQRVDLLEHCFAGLRICQHRSDHPLAIERGAVHRLGGRRGEDLPGGEQQERARDREADLQTTARFDQTTHGPEPPFCSARREAPANPESQPSLAWIEGELRLASRLLCEGCPPKRKARRWTKSRIPTVIAGAHFSWASTSSKYCLSTRTSRGFPPAAGDTRPSISIMSTSRAARLKPIRSRRCRY